MEEYLEFSKSNCKNCYNALRHCPVKSIRFSANQAHIISEECILCGQCMLICPQNAKRIRNDVEKAKVILAQNKVVAASIAPSFVANYENATVKSMERALKKLGFSIVEETAIGATLVKKNMSALFLKKIKNYHQFLLSDDKSLNREILSGNITLSGKCPFTDAGTLQKNQARESRG